MLLFDHDGGASIQLLYAGDPMTAATEAAKLETFCLACHGDGTANGATSTPFSGGAGSTIPTVDETQWLASSHEGAASMTGGCFGNGAFGCHGNGHGSNGQSLLSPYLMTTASDLKEDEEGFCLNCHDSDGPASSDRKTNMSQAINWSTLPAGLNDLTTLNDRHDIQTSAQA